MQPAHTYTHIRTHEEEQQETVQLLLSTGRTNRRYLAILTVHPASFISPRSLRLFMPSGHTLGAFHQYLVSQDQLKWKW